MDYRGYKDLMERYYVLNEFTTDQEETKDGLIKKLMDISCEKSRFLTRRMPSFGITSKNMKKIPVCLTKRRRYAGRFCSPDWA